MTHTHLMYTHTLIMYTHTLIMYTHTHLMYTHTLKEWHTHITCTHTHLCVHLMYTYTLISQLAQTIFHVCILYTHHTEVMISFDHRLNHIHIPACVYDLTCDQMILGCVLFYPMGNTSSLKQPWCTHLLLATWPIIIISGSYNYHSWPVTFNTSTRLFCISTR